MQPFRVANLSFLNSAPYAACAEVEGIEYAAHLPVENEQLLARGSVDAALVSLASYLSQPDLALLPFGIIGDGPVESVMLYSRVPVEAVKTVLLDSSSRTSVLLAQVLLSNMPRMFSPDLSLALEAALKGECAAVVIGDRALQLRGRFPFQYDLCELWKERTGLPFVFAVWAVKAATLSHPCLPRLLTAFEKGVQDLTHYAQEWSVRHNLNQEYARHYLHECIRFKVTPRALEGSRLFYRVARSRGLLPAVAREESLQLSAVGPHAESFQVALR
ncbi:MAG: menaquinone biosynthesis protein [Bdellovibrionota bacterium]|nr:MAG: menaquinone biosynthesis protein [Bdellovibrionota bacterium]